MYGYYHKTIDTANIYVDIIIKYINIITRWILSQDYWHGKQICGHYNRLYIYTSLYSGLHFASSFVAPKTHLWAWRCRFCCSDLSHQRFTRGFLDIQMLLSTESCTPLLTTPNMEWKQVKTPKSEPQINRKRRCNRNEEENYPSWNGAKR